MNQTNTRRTDIPLTLRESVKDAFAERGLSISQWARKHNLAPQYVYDLLNGRTNGARGESHRAAVLLGLKEGVDKKEMERELRAAEKGEEAPVCR